MPEPAQGPELRASALADAFGGGRGLLDSSVPAAVFVVARLVSGSLWTAIGLAVASGVVLLLLRVRRGETLQQVASGFVGLVLAVLVARATGTGKGFFLPGILTTAATGVAFAASLVLRRPAVALALAAYDPRYAGWADHPRLRRACTTATAVWAATFFVRAGVAWWVYSLPGDRDGLLLVVINLVKWPLIVLAAVLTVVLVKRSGYDPDSAEADAAAAAAVTTGSDTTAPQGTGRDDGVPAPVAAAVGADAGRSVRVVGEGAVADATGRGAQHPGPGPAD